MNVRIYTHREAAEQNAASFVWLGDYEKLLDIVSEMVDPEPCSFDHHGYCQEHNLQKPCPHEQAKELLRDAL